MYVSFFNSIFYLSVTNITKFPKKPVLISFNCFSYDCRVKVDFFSKFTLLRVLPKFTSKKKLLNQPNAPTKWRPVCCSHQSLTGLEMNPNQTSSIQQRPRPKSASISESACARVYEYVAALQDMRYSCRLIKFYSTPQGGSLCLLLLLLLLLVRPTLGEKEQRKRKL